LFLDDLFDNIVLRAPKTTDEKDLISRNLAIYSPQSRIQHHFRYTYAEQGEKNDLRRDCREFDEHLTGFIPFLAFNKVLRAYYIYNILNKKDIKKLVFMYAKNASALQNLMSENKTSQNKQRGTLYFQSSKLQRETTMNLPFEDSSLSSPSNEASLINYTLFCDHIFDESLTYHHKYKSDNRPLSSSHHLSTEHLASNTHLFYEREEDNEAHGFENQQYEREHHNQSEHVILGDRAIIKLCKMFQMNFLRGSKKKRRMECLLYSFDYKKNGRIAKEDFDRLIRQLMYEFNILFIEKDIFIDFLFPEEAPTIQYREFINATERRDPELLRHIADH
jgi:hypothetical protein